jgi:hypothetical protein
MPCRLSVTVFEALGRDGQPRFNAHVIVVMPDAYARDRLIESLHRSSVYAGRVDARPADNWNGLTTYLLKEATPQAWFAAGKSFRRIRGSIPLGDLGGDRVVLSRDMKDALIASGRIATYQRTYAKRQPPSAPGAVFHRRARSRMADRPPLEPTPTPAAVPMIHGGRSEQRPEAFLRRRAELVAEPEGQLVDANGAVHGDGLSPRQSVRPRRSAAKSALGSIVEWLNAHPSAATTASASSSSFGSNASTSADASPNFLMSNDRRSLGLEGAQTMGEAKRRRGIRGDPTLDSAARLISAMHAVDPGGNQNVARMTHVMEATEELVKAAGGEASLVPAVGTFAEIIGLLLAGVLHPNDRIEDCAEQIKLMIVHTAHEVRQAMREQLQ